MKFKHLLALQFLLLINQIFSQVIISSSQNVTSQIVGSSDGIVVQKGATLTISAGNWQFNSYKGITVEKGGHLVISGNVNLKGPTGNFWQGISAEGEYLLDQYSIGHWPNQQQLNNTASWNGQLHPQQTSVILNGFKLSNAICGVESILGAVIRINDCQFLDNYNGVTIKRYVSPSNGLKELNASYIMDSQFTWSMWNSYSNKIGIYLEEIRGINIGGCIFSNNMPVVDESQYFYRGIGIKCENASFALTKSGNQWCYDNDECLTVCYSVLANSKSNKFENLFKGVDIHNIYYIPFAVTNCEFINNLKSVEVSKSSDIAIKDNIFFVNTISMNAYFQNISNITNVIISHVKCWETERFIIRENEFSGNGNQIFSIDIKDCGNDQSDIIANSISNSNTSNTISSGVRGINLDGNCKYIYINCNLFSNQGVDIYVDMGAMVYSENFINGGPSYTSVKMFNPQKKGLTNTFSNPLNGRINVALVTPLGTSETINDIYYYANQIGPSLSNIPNQYSLFTINTGIGVDNCNKTCSQLNSIELTSSKLTIYPNPGNGKYVKVNANNQTLDSLLIFNAVGTLINNFPNIQTDGEINLDLPSGLYFIIGYSKSSILNCKYLVE